jgi:hypothetical protein
LPREILKDRAVSKNSRNASPFFGTGIHPTGDGGLASDAFDGDLATDDAGTTGWAANDEAMAVGRLILRPGSIGNDSLTNPVAASVHKCSASAFSLSLTDTEKAGVNITVPAGFTQAQAVISGRMYAINPNTTGGADTTGTDALYVRVGIAANYSTATPTGISGSNGFATTTCDDAYVLTGLTPGGTIRLNVLGSCAYQPISATADNFISATASISWLR